VPWALCFWLYTLSPELCALSFLVNFRPVSHISGSAQQALLIYVCSRFRLSLNCNNLYYHLPVNPAFFVGFLSPNLLFPQSPFLPFTQSPPLPFISRQKWHDAIIIYFPHCSTMVTDLPVLLLKGDFLPHRDEVQHNLLFALLIPLPA
jgi:hypothetical protein